MPKECEPLSSGLFRQNKLSKNDENKLRMLEEETGNFIGL